MTPYYDAWVAALGRRDTVITTLFVMALAIIAAWVAFTDLIYPRMSNESAKRISKIVFLGGGFALYWGTIIAYAMQ